MSKPYKEEIKNGIKYREFDHMVETDELVWHRDKRDRKVTVLEGEGWFFQMDNDIPRPMKEGEEFFVPKEEYHRIYKQGTTPLKISIKETYMQTFKEFTEAKSEKELDIKDLEQMIKKPDSSRFKQYGGKAKYIKMLKDKLAKLKEFTEAKGSTIDQIKAIISNKQRAKVGGKMIDLQTASIIAQIYDKVNSATKKKMENEKIDKLLKIASMVMKKESTDIHEGYAIDLNPWKLSHGGQSPKGKGTWAFDYKVSVDSGGMIGLQQDTFFSKAMSTYKDAVKQLTKFLKKEFKAKPKDIKINLAP